MTLDPAPAALSSDRNKEVIDNKSVNRGRFHATPQAQKSALDEFANPVAILFERKLL